jgi:Leucine-rich repeat (LRR) protein
MLDCSKNALTTLNLNGCKSIETLNCSDNSIVTLDLTALKSLETLNCSGNDFVSLDVSANAALASVDCSDNASLAKLWVKDAAHQEQMTINKDNATNVFFNAGNIIFPDVVLKTYLVDNYDENGDREISIEESENITAINCSEKGVTDLTGLEVCTNLQTLNCSNNSIKSIELPNLKQLKSVTCSGCPIEKLNFDGCSSLIYLNLQGATTNAIVGKSISINDYNQATTFYVSIVGTPFTSFSFTNDSDLTNIDMYGEFTDINLSGNSILESVNVSTMSQLKTLNVRDCKLKTLDVTQNLSLTSLFCDNNELTTLDVNNNTLLTSLYCANNKLSRINVTANYALKEFDIENNLLSVLNVTNNTALKYLKVNNNAEISMLDVSNNSELNTLYANGLAIGDIDLKKNSRLTYVNLKNNSNLKTIIVWDECTTSRNNYLHFDMGDIEVYDDNGNSYGYPYKIGQYIPWLYGGIVFETSNGEKNGKMVSMSRSSGTLSSAESWCREYGDGWGIPSIDDLTNISRSNCGVTLSGSYWSGSTKYDSSTRKTWYLYWDNGWEEKTTLYDKNFNVVAVRSF